MSLLAASQQQLINKTDGHNKQIITTRTVAKEFIPSYLPNSLCKLTTSVDQYITHDTSLLIRSFRLLAG